MLDFILRPVRSTKARTEHHF